MTRHLMNGCRLLAVSLVLIATWGGLQAASAAENLRVRAGVHADFGRIVFDPPKAMRYTARAERDRVEIRFAEPVSASFGEVRRVLGDYVREIALDGDDTVVVTLNGPHRTRDFLSGQSVVIDLRPLPGGAHAGRTTVGTRFGQHANYTRLVFDWPANVGYRLTNDAGDVTLRFSKPADIVFDPARLRAARGFSAARVEPNTTSGTVVRLDVNGRVRHFRDGFKVVVDVFDPEPQTAAAPPAPAPERRDPTPVSEATGPGSETAAAPTERAGTPVLLTPEPPADPDVSTAQASATPVDLLLPEMVPAPRNPDALAAGVSTLDIEVKAELDGALIRFPFAEPTAAALFRRGGRLWVVFDRLARIDTEEIIAAAAGSCAVPKAM